MPPPPRVRDLAVLAALVGLAGCGGGGNSVVSTSTKKLGDVHSGILALKVLVRPEGGAGRHPFGFELKGPFSFGKGAPLARMTYTQIANGTTGSATLVLGPASGYVESNGRRRTLTAVQLRAFRDAAQSAASGGGLNLRDWATSARQRDCGTDAVCVDGELDPAKALGGMLQLQESLGPATVVEDSDTLVKAVRSTSYNLVAAKKDKQLRHLAIAIHFRLDVPRKLRAGLGRYVGATIEFAFGLQKPNADVGLH
jgi:hypothetical protein